MNDENFPRKNLFQTVPDTLSQELTEVLIKHKDVRIERIVSAGHASPQDFWYDQEEHEWVVLLQGEALLQIEDWKEPIRLCAGDHVCLAPHQRHRVEWTIPDEPTIWLAVFYS